MAVESNGNTAELHVITEDDLLAKLRNLAPKKRGPDLSILNNVPRAIDISEQNAENRIKNQLNALTNAIHTCDDRIVETKKKLAELQLKLTTVIDPTATTPSHEPSQPKDPQNLTAHEIFGWCNLAISEAERDLYANEDEKLVTERNTVVLYLKHLNSYLAYLQLLRIYDSSALKVIEARETIFLLSNPKALDQEIENLTAKITEAETARREAIEEYKKVSKQDEIARAAAGALKNWRNNIHTALGMYDAKINDANTNKLASDERRSAAKQTLVNLKAELDKLEPKGDSKAVIDLREQKAETERLISKLQEDKEDVLNKIDTVLGTINTLPTGEHKTALDQEASNSKYDESTLKETTNIKKTDLDDADRKVDRASSEVAKIIAELNAKRATWIEARTVCANEAGKGRDADDTEVERLNTISTTAKDAYEKAKADAAERLSQIRGELGYLQSLLGQDYFVKNLIPDAMKKLLEPETMITALKAALTEMEVMYFTGDSEDSLASKFDAKISENSARKGELLSEIQNAEELLDNANKHHDSDVQNHAFLQEVKDLLENAKLNIDPSDYLNTKREAADQDYNETITRIQVIDDTKRGLLASIDTLTAMKTLPDNKRAAKKLEIESNATDHTAKVNALAPSGGANTELTDAYDKFKDDLIAFETAVMEAKPKEPVEEVISRIVIEVASALVPAIVQANERSAIVNSQIVEARNQLNATLDQNNKLLLGNKKLSEALIAAITAFGVAILLALGANFFRSTTPPTQENVENVDDDDSADDYDYDSGEDDDDATDDDSTNEGQPNVEPTPTAAPSPTPTPQRQATKPAESITPKPHTEKTKKRTWGIQ